jgi:hypothetical protein
LLLKPSCERKTVDKCEHIWLYIGSKRQKVWRCTLCDEYRVEDPKQKREWQGLTDDEVMKIIGVTSADSDWNVIIVHKWIRAIEDKLREKNGY